MTNGVKDAEEGARWSEAVLLALSSAAAYAVAYSFEKGYADCLGYPHWLIEVGLINVLTAWTTIAVAL